MTSEPTGFVAANYRRLLLGILVLGAALRLGIYLDLRANDPLFFTPILDSRVFLEWAERIAGGDILGDRVFFLNPLYPYCLAPIHSLAGDATLTVVRLLQAVMGLGTVLLVAGATRRFLGGGAALAAAALAAVYPVTLFYEQMVMIATLAVFLNALALYLLARLSETRSLRTAFLAGLPLGLAILARPNVALFAVLLPIWLLSLAGQGRRFRFAASRTAVMGAAALLMVLPVTLRNWHVGGDFVPVTSSAGVNLHLTNNAKARAEGRMDSDRGLRFGPGELEEDSARVAEAEAGRKLEPSEVSAYWTGVALSDFRESPGPSLGFLGRKLLFFLQGPEFPSSHAYAIQEETSALLGIIPLHFGVLSPFALLGCLAVLRRRRRGLPPVLLFLAYAFGLAVFFPLGHYRAPVLPAAFALAAAGVAEIVGARCRGRLCRRLILLAGLAALVHSTLIARSLGAEGLTGYRDTEGVIALNRGRHLLSLGHLDEAEPWLVQARERVRFPHHADVALAEIALERGDYAETAARLGAASREVEQPAPAWMAVRRSWCYFKLGDPRRALATAEAALLEHPGDGELSLKKAIGLLIVHPERKEEIRRAAQVALDASLVLPRNLREFLRE